VLPRLSGRTRPELSAAISTRVQQRRRPAAASTRTCGPTTCPTTVIDQPRTNSHRGDRSAPRRMNRDRQPDRSGPDTTVPGRIDRWTKRAMHRGGWARTGSGRRSGGEPRSRAGAPAARRPSHGPRRTPAQPARTTSASAGKRSSGAPGQPTITAPGRLPVTAGQHAIEYSGGTGRIRGVQIGAIARHLRGDPVGGRPSAARICQPGPVLPSPRRGSRPREWCMG